MRTERERIAVSEDKVAGKSFSEDRAVWKCVLSPPEESGTLLLEVCKAAPVPVMETWEDNPWNPWAHCQELSFLQSPASALWFCGVMELYLLSNHMWKNVFPFPFPTGFVESRH